MEQQTENDLDFSIGPENTENLEENTSETVEETAEQQTNETTEAETTDDATQEAQTEVDEDEAFIRSKYLDPTDPEALKKLAGMYRNAERLINEKSQKAAQLERALEGQKAEQQPQGQVDPTAMLAKQVQELKNDAMANEFRTRTQLTPEMEGKMADYLSQPVQLANGQVVRRGALVTGGLMSLDEVYQLCGGGQIDPTQLKETIRKQTLEEIANKQKAVRLKSSSTDQTKFNSEEADPFADALFG